MDFIRWIRVQWDRSGALLAAIAGAVALILGWVGVSGATLPTQQISYLASGGLVGLFLLGIAATLWLSADLRDEWRKLDEIHRSFRREPVANVGAGYRDEDRPTTEFGSVGAHYSELDELSPADARDEYRR
jgi:hypothetical protein